MKRVIPITALITGLLGLPGALPAPARAETQTPAIEAFPAEMPGTVAEEMRRVARGVPLDAFGMQRLQRRMALAMEQRLAGLVGQTAPPKLITVQLIESKGRGEMVLPATPLEKAAFLGVVVTPVSAESGQAMKLPRGVGLVVNFVETGSPAEKAGLKINDIVEKLDDQVLVNGPQLAVLLRAKKPGDTIKLTVARPGEEDKPRLVEVSLAEKELPVLEGLGQVENDQSVSSSIHQDADGTVTRRRIDNEHDILVLRTPAGQETITTKDREGHVLFEGPVEKLATAQLPAALMKKIESLRQSPMHVEIGKDLARAVGDAGEPVPGAAGMASSRSLVMDRKDDQHDILVRVVNGDRHLTVKAIATGAVLFDGPANSDDDLKKLPPEVQPKVQQMLEKMK